jgi:hypothetical protein
MESCSSGSGLSKLQSKVLDTHRAHHPSSLAPQQARGDGGIKNFLAPGSTRPAGFAETSHIPQYRPLAPLSSGRSELRQDMGLIQEFSSFKQQQQQSQQQETINDASSLNTPATFQNSLTRRPFAPVWNNRSSSNFNSTSPHQDVGVRNDNLESWDKEFNKLSLVEDDQSVTTYINADTDKEALAASADHLINVMDASSSDKFKKSQFLKFLHQVSDTTHKEISQPRPGDQVCPLF